MKPRTYRNALKLLVTVGIFYIIFNQIGIGSVIDAFSLFDWRWVLAAVAIYPIRIMLQNTRWRMLLRDHGVDVPMWTLLKRSWIGHFFSNFLPGKVGGDIYRVFGRTDFTVHRSTLASSVLLDRLVGIVALLSYVCIAGLLQFSVINEAGMGVLLLLSAFAITLLLPLFLTHAPKHWLLGMLHRLPESRPRQIAISIVNALIAGTSRKSTIALTFIISMMAHLLGALKSYFSLRAMGFDGSVTTVLLIVPLVNLIAQVPISLNGLGLREGAFTLLFSGVGVPAPVSIGAALIDRMTNIGMSLFGGILYQRSLSTSKKN